MANMFQIIERIDPDTGLPIVDQRTSFEEAFAPFLATQPNTPAASNMMPAANNFGDLHDRSALTPNNRTFPALASNNRASLTPVLQAAPQQQPQVPKRPKISFLDTIGRISDVLATVGGAEPLYQPILDAEEDRQRQIQTQELQRRQLQQKIAVDDIDIADRNMKMIGAIARGLQSVRNSGGDIGAAWSVLSQRMNMPADQAQALGRIFQSNPDVLEAVIGMTGGGTEYGMQPFYAQAPDGSLRAYQLGRDGSVRPIQLGEGETPIDPLRFVDVGGAQVGVGTRSGVARNILPKSLSPDTAANIQSREQINTANIRSRERMNILDNQTRRINSQKTNGPGTNDTRTKGREKNEVAKIVESFNIDLFSPDDPVENMIRNSTNGTIQNAASSILGMFGITTEGRKNIAQLETIDNALVLALAGGKLGAGVSNADRDFFQKMAGKISDPNAPVEQRMAAWRMIKERLKYLAQEGNTTANRQTLDRAGIVREARRRGLR